MKSINIAKQYLQKNRCQLKMVSSNYPNQLNSKICIFIRVLQNATKVEIELFILVLDHVKRSQKALVEVSRCDNQMSTFVL